MGERHAGESRLVRGRSPASSFPFWSERRASGPWTSPACAIETGLITYDPSLGNTGVCRSAITFIDGEKGILRYRGIPIEQFTAKPNFVEVAWLLIFGRLPKQDELARFSGLLTANELLHEGVKHQFQHIPPDAPPMAILSATLSNLACYHQQFLALEDEESLEEAAARLISKVRTIAAFSYRRSLGLPFIYPDPNLRYCANFLHMMFSIPYQQYIVTPEVEDALNLIFILHADHEQNCSTSTVRVVGSARANLFASCAAAVCALWGPLHGGANVEVMEMLERIHQRRHSRPRTASATPRTRPTPSASSASATGSTELRSAGEDPQGGLRQGLRPAEAEGPAAGHRPQAGRAGPGRPLLRRAAALSERGFLQRHHAAGDGHPHQHVHRLLRHRPAAGLDRPVEGAARRPDHQDPPPAANLHRPEPDRLRADREKDEGPRVEGGGQCEAASGSSSFTSSYSRLSSSSRIFRISAAWSTSGNGSDVHAQRPVVAEPAQLGDELAVLDDALADADLELVLGRVAQADVVDVLHHLLEVARRGEP